MKRVTFRNKDIDIAGNLYVPDDLDEQQAYAAIVLTTPDCCRS